MLTFTSKNSLTCILIRGATFKGDKSLLIPPSPSETFQNALYLGIFVNESVKNPVAFNSLSLVLESSILEVPADVKLFVGHDPRPMIGEPDFDNFQPTPTTVKNKQGGTTTFLDAGSGKGGNLWGAVVNSANNSIEALINFGQ